MGEVEFRTPNDPRIRRPGRWAGRPQVRLDMTPMVDVAFLLLIFFMVSTVFRQPQALEMMVPPASPPVPIPESNVLTLFAGSDGSLKWRMAREMPQAVSLANLGEVLRSHRRANPEVVVLVKLHPKARYGTMVDLLDELEGAEMKRFSLVRMTPQEAASTEGLPGVIP